MKKINKIVLFKMAWNLKKAGAYETFGAALKAAWQVMKEAAAEIRVKDWFLRKNFSDGERYAISVSYSSNVERETEKAVLVRWATKFGAVTRWIPKSCLA